jgi:hypothetical protein
MDPFAVLGVARDAPPDELAAAYRREAKRWHPDRGGGDAAAKRMAEINAAYDLVRDGGWRSAMAAAAGAGAQPGPRPAPRQRPRGSWLSETMRRALGGELIVALLDGEDVGLVTPVSTWASPSALLAVTDRRLLWLLDDTIGQRVHALPFREIAELEVVQRRLRRHVASLRVRTVKGRRLTFAELRPATAKEIERRIGAARAAAA